MLPSSLAQGIFESSSVAASPSEATRKSLDLIQSMGGFIFSGCLFALRAFRQGEHSHLAAQIEDLEAVTQ